MQNAQNQISIDESSFASGGIGSIRTKTLQRDHLVKRIMGLQTEKAKLMQMSSHQLDVKLSLLERQYDFFEKIQGDTRVVQQPSLVAHRPHLPTLQLTKFSGDYKEWMGFYNMFCELVHENPELSNIAKFQYLKSCLTDTAARLIQSLEVTADNYESALDMLKQRFDNKRLIFQAHLLNMFQLQSIQKPTVASIRLFIDNINSSLRALRSFASPDQIADGVLLLLIVSKLDKESQSKWEDDIYFSCDLNKSSTSFQLPNWDNLSNFLERRCKTLEIVEITHSNAVREQQKQVQSHSHQQVPRRIASSFITSSEHSKCILCGIGPSHNPFHCTKLCPSQNRCQHCNGLHHTLLHKETLSEVGAATQENVDDANATTNESIALQTSKENAPVILATAIVEICAANGISTMARALLDSCSQSNFITERMANQLKVMRKRVNTKISGIGGTDVFCANHTCTITAKSLTTAFSPTFEAVIIPTISSCHPNQFVNVTSWKIPANIPLADKYFNIPSSIDILMGVDLFWEVLMVGRIKIENQPNFMKTKLGWIVTGSIEGSLQHQRSVSTHVTEVNITPQSQCKSTEFKYNPSLSSSSEPLLDKLLELFWNLENHEPSRKSILSLEELECEKFFHETTRRCPQTNKFIVRLPFKSTSPVLGQSRQRAQRRLFHLESRLDRDNEIKNEYHRFMKEYMELNHMCVSKQNDVLYHIPHHCVVKPDSSTTRLRVVFDASCATTNGKSLNDLLLVGPTLQDNIFTILTRFRYHKFVLVADIAKMYRQVLVDESDQKWQSILWREHTSKQVETYNLKTVTYGTSCAPYLAVKCLQQTGKEGLERYPLGAKAVLRDFYVDNLMTGADTVEELKIIMKEVIEVLKCGGFPLRKFASNKESVLSDIHPSEREEIVEVEYMHYIKTLGLKWSPTDDVFSFSYSNSECSNTTKRSILAQMASFFDPIGFVNPIISRCKILMQELWRLKIHWDESVPHDIFSEWSHIRKELALVSRLLIPRYVTFNENTCVHVFVDASKRAYGACIYAVTTTNTIESKLLCAKSKVAPIKDTSLPRLELCAALLGSELLHSIKPSFPNAPHKIFCWSDSTITLAWISNEPSRWQSFISNRVEKIQRLTHDCIWQHVPSNLNPADLLSRGTNVNNENKEFWFQGPKFLKHHQTNWPKQHHMSTELDTVQDVTSLMSSAVEDIISSHKYVNRLRGRPLSKVYLAVFICFSVKAVHLELVPELTTESFISALKRFIARRGHCSTIYSDNATNFIGANRELREMLKSFMSDDHYKMVNEACGEAGITWRFIPPRSPHFGGLWESAVKQAKHYIRRTIGYHILSHDEMHTVCYQSEAIINSRPLTPLSSDPNDLRPLTPAHFLIGRPLTTLAEPSVVQVNPASLKRYQMVQWIQQQFWDRWRNEYLKTLQQKTKWSTTMINLQVNDLVLLKEENVPPLKWPLARVISCSPGDDGYVRVVTVKTADGTFKRSITKLCKLPISICDMHQKPMHKKRSLCTTIYVQSVGRTKGTRETEKTLSDTLPTAKPGSTSVNIVRIKINTK
ncbi:uncharacterized protein LOC142225233 [Haematobia irritans]|uniref:uncharacterized protein LOC142225233 n=1 Tax=Haematobia irritans TaxID=7368 RepID=UPI003F50A5D9